MESFCGRAKSQKKVPDSKAAGRFKGILPRCGANLFGWLAASPTAGTDPGVVTVSLHPSGLATGPYTGTITVSDPHAVNSPQTVTVNLEVINASQDQPPLGSFDTPGDGSTVRSSTAVTGWALDDVEVESVTIYRRQGSQSIYIGEAVLVEGARPDVETAYPNYPKNGRAGWGYMLLTNFLPGGGNGTYLLYAAAKDVSGNGAILGSKTIICDNANAVKPFGAIDTPTQGGTASGSGFINWGWVLTPQPNSIPTDGSTINVYIDGVNIGNPVYNNYRADIAGLFPGYANSNGAVGYFFLDTVQYENGVHTIQWTAADSAGNTDGIGSRYFTVRNTGETRQQQRFKVHGSRFTVDCSRLPVADPKPVRVKKGYGKNRTLQTLYPGEKGDITIEIKELERLEIHFFDAKEPTAGTNLEHRTLNISSLPIGSTIDPGRGVFYWQPGPGFLGEYRLVFLSGDTNGTGTRRNVTIKISPGFQETVR